MVRVEEWQEQEREGGNMWELGKKGVTDRDLREKVDGGEHIWCRDQSEEASGRKGDKGGYESTTESGGKKRVKGKRG